MTTTVEDVGKLPKGISERHARACRKRDVDKFGQRVVITSA